MIIKVDINRETKLIIFYFRRYDLKYRNEQSIHPDKTVEWFSQRLKEIMFILQDAFEIDYTDYRPDVSFLNDAEFDAIIPNKNTELIIINKR